MDIEDIPENGNSEPEYDEEEFEVVDEELIIVEYGKKYSKFKSFPDTIKVIENELESKLGIEVKVFS